MTERRSSFLGKLTLRTKRSNRQLATSASSSSPVTTPDLETPSGFSGPSDYGLGYSSINHERSPSCKDIRTSRALQSRPIEFDRYADSSTTQKHRVGTTRSKKLSVVHDEEHPLFVEIFHEAAPTPIIQSTVRAQSSSSSSSPPNYADFDLLRPQSPFAITSSASQSRIIRPPSRISPRRTQSANDSEAVRPYHSTTRASSELAAAAAASGQSFYAVGRGWKKGVYTTKEEAQRQIKNFPGPLLQVFRDRAAAEDFISNAGRFAAQSPTQEESEDELVERTRIFNGLDPNSEAARRRTIGISAERKESQRRSRMHIATHSPVLHQDGATFNFPPLSLRSMFSDVAPITPIEEINGFGSFPAPVPLQSMSLLPVKHLVSSIAFYAKVLGFACISHLPDVQAVMSSSSATVCLRTVDQAPPPSTGTNVSRQSMIPTATPDPLLRGRTPLPTMSEAPHSDDINLWLPPTPDSVSLSCAEPEPLKLPLTALSLGSTTSTLSGTTVLIEYNGALEAMHSLLTARLNEWRLESTKASSAQHPSESARILNGGVQQTPWDAQELHLCDLDGHRIIYTSPFARKPSLN